MWMACAGRRQRFTDFRCVAYVVAQMTWTNSKNLRLLTQIPLIFLQLPMLHPKTTPSSSWQTLTLPTFLLRIPYASQPQPLNYGHGITNSKPQRHIPPLYFPNHLVGTVMAIVLDPLLEAYSNLDQVARDQTRLSIPSMCHTSNPLTVRIETSFQLLTMVSLPSTNKRSLPGEEAGSSDLLACYQSIHQSVRWCQLVLDSMFLILSRNRHQPSSITDEWFPIHFDCLGSHRLFLSPASPVLSRLKISSTGPFLRRRTTSNLFSSSSTSFNPT